VKEKIPQCNIRSADPRQLANPLQTEDKGEAHALENAKGVLEIIRRSKIRGQSLALLKNQYIDIAIFPITKCVACQV
jgi:hypothetical protein